MIHRNEIKSIIHLALPALVGQLGQMMLGVTDSIMVGKVGASSLAAASLALGLFILVLIFGIGVSMAITPLVAMSVGSNKFTQIGNIFKQGFLVNNTLGIALTLLTVTGADMISWLGQPEEIVKLAASYLKIMGLSIIPIMIFQTYKQTIEGLEVMRPAMLITLLANLVNIFGNWILIYGNLGFPALGLAGAGWATLITRCLMALSIILYVSAQQRFQVQGINLKDFGVDWSIIKKILKLGVSSGVQYFFEVGAFSGSVIIIGWIGTADLAAHQIAINLASISYMFALSISAAAVIRVGTAVGRRDIMATRSAGFNAMLLSATVMGVFGIIFVILRSFLPRLYIDNPQVISVASTLLIIAALFQMFDGIQAVGIGILRGIADTKIPMFITFIAYWVVGLPGGYLLGIIFKMGVEGVWIALLCSLLVSASMLSRRFHKRSRQEIII